jgi:aryl-alcohol dehydrogenase-like predicted oxidoreductase
MILPLEKRKLGRTAIEVTSLGFGASSIGAEFGQFDIAKSLSAVRTAVDAGINLIDTAAYYGRGMSEVLLGQILPAYRRESLVVSTKLGRYAPKHFDFSAKRVAESIDVSLERMRLDYLDMVFCHDIEYADVQQVIDETLPALRRQVEKGKVRYVGISGYPMRNFQKVIPTGLLDCVITYNHYTLQNDMALQWQGLAQKHGVGVINPCPSGIKLPSRFAPSRQKRRLGAKLAAHRSRNSPCSSPFLIRVLQAVWSAARFPLRFLNGSLGSRNRLTRSSSTEFEPNLLRFAIGITSKDAQRTMTWTGPNRCTASPDPRRFSRRRST